MDSQCSGPCEEQNNAARITGKVFVEMPSSQKLEIISDSCVLNAGTDEQWDCLGYGKCQWKRILFYTLTILTIGFPLILIRWKPVWGVWWLRSKCSVALADRLILESPDKQFSVAKVITKSISKLPHEFTRLLWTPTNEVSGDVDDDGYLTLNQSCYLKYFIHQELRYFWDHNLNNYYKLSGFDANTTCSDLFEKFKGYSEEQQKQRLELFGNNSISVVVKSYSKLLFEEVLHPFYVFQIFSVILWSFEEYYLFSACTLTVSLVSVSVSLYKTRKQSEALHEMVSDTSSNSVTVIRKDKTCEISSFLLVPGDVIIIPPHGCVMNCDAVLVAGNCIVNESMLTGESVPVTKTPLLYQESEMYSPQHHKRHTLFCGTEVIQTRYYEGKSVSAVVVRTGFSTSKGELVRAILFPKQIDFKFYRDAAKFIGVLSVIASLGMIYTATVFIVHGVDAGFIILRVLNIVTIVVPPSLPAAMTVGYIYAQNRLRTKDIYCISPNRINVAGKLRLICFDKTGTLTEDGLDMWGVVPYENGSLHPLVLKPSTLPTKSALLAAMASCHSLTIIDGQLTGDPLDLKVFDSTRWELLEMQQEQQSRFSIPISTIVRPVLMERKSSRALVQETEFQTKHEIGIVRQFPFSSTLQMMSVITQTHEEDHMNLYAKGAPEKIVSTCLTSTIPPNFNELLLGYTVQGFRVIAIAWKELDKTLTWHQAQKIKRDELERDMNFLGLIVMQNALKRETAPVIDDLNAANIRTVMVTGDNMQTAISVGRNCRMIGPNERIIIVNAIAPTDDHPASFKCEASDTSADITSKMSEISSTSDNGFRPGFHFSTDGKSFAVVRQFFPDLLIQLAIRGTIFARMTPDQKTQLVELLQEQGYIVGMCGDGANDCGALKAAHVGISLSETEASVAAPFTSKIPNVECVPHVIKEGRGALVTSFGVFKFVALYSIIQFVSVMILYRAVNSLSDSQFLLIDLVYATAFAVTMGYTASFDRLTRASPHGTLLSPAILTSMFVQIILSVAFQVSAFIYLTYQPWYIPYETKKRDKYEPSLEATVIFCLSSFQYIAVAFTVSKGKPFRKPMYTNVPLFVSFIGLTALSIVLLVCPPYWIEEFLKMKYENEGQDFNFRLLLLLFVLAHFALSYLTEYFVETSAFKTISHFITRKKHPKHQYKVIEKQLLETLTFP